MRRPSIIPTVDFDERLDPHSETERLPALARRALESAPRGQDAGHIGK